jgi:signal transduction histidine kinase
MKIKHQLSLLFLSICFFIVTVISLVFYNKVKEIILTQLYDQLESISQTKQIRVTFMIKKKLEMTKIFANNFALITNLQKYKSHPSEKYLKETKALLKQMKEKSNSLRKLHVLTKNGIVIISTDSTYEGKNYSREESFLKAINEGKFLDGVFYNEDQELNIYSSSPINYDGKMMGVLLIEMDAADLISLTSDYTGLGRTGETILGKIDNGIILLTPVRFDRNSTNKKIDVNDGTSHNEPFISKKEGLKKNIRDYRNKLVISSTRYFPQTDWIMITKIDEEEAYAPILQIRNLLIAINIISILFSLIFAYLLGKYLARPIEALTHSIHKIQEGHISQMTEIRTNNEMGVLAKSFNTMAGNLWSNLKELKQSNEGLEKFAYVISHDLRSPLNSILSIAEVLKIEYREKLGQEGILLINMQIEKANQMNELIIGVLESAKKGHKNALKEKIELNSLLPKVIETLSPPSNIKIIVQKNLPMIHYYKIPIMQVFQNLIGNAIKYMNKEKGEIKVGCKRENSFHKFYICDNGPGIRKEDQEKIFNMFEFANTDKSIESSGIGLSIVKKIIEENKGSIWVESNYGEGCTFYFTIPVENTEPIS